MKNLFSVLVLAIGMIAFSANDVSAQANPGGVEVVKNGNWSLLTPCGSTPSLSATEQYKDGVLHMRTIKYQLPAGCSFIPTQATTYQINPNYSIKIMPSGMVVSKIVINPNQPTP